MIRPVALLASLAPFLCLAIAQSTNDQVAVYDESDTYAYYGCYNETTSIAESAHLRALGDGIDEVKNDMTVPLCLEFCGKGDVQYLYAGLEFSKECWCSETILGISAKLDDSECNLPCKGNDSMACGGALKLTVYRVSGAPTGMAVPGLLLISGFALALMS